MAKRNKGKGKRKRKKEKENKNRRIKEWKKQQTTAGTRMET